MEIHLHTQILTSLLEGSCYLRDQAPLPRTKSPGLSIIEKASKAPQLVWAKKSPAHEEVSGPGRLTPEDRVPGTH